MTPSKRPGNPEAPNESLFSFFRRNSVKTPAKPPLTQLIRGLSSSTSSTALEANKKRVTQGWDYLEQSKQLLSNNKHILGSAEAGFQDRLQKMLHDAPSQGKLSKKRLSRDMFVVESKALYDDIQKALGSLKVDAPKSARNYTSDYPRKRSRSPKIRLPLDTERPRVTYAQEEPRPRAPDMERKDSDKPSTSSRTKDRRHNEVNISSTQDRPMKYDVQPKPAPTTDGDRYRYRDVEKRSDPKVYPVQRRRSYERPVHYKDKEYNRDTEKREERPKGSRFYSDTSDYLSKDTRQRRHEKERSSHELSRRPSPERSRKTSPNRARRTSPDRTRRTSPDRSRRLSPEESRRPSSPGPAERTRKQSPPRTQRAPSPRSQRPPSPRSQPASSSRPPRPPSPRSHAVPSPHHPRPPSPRTQQPPSAQKQHPPSPRQQRPPSPRYIVHDDPPLSAMLPVRGVPIAPPTFVAYPGAYDEDTRPRYRNRDRQQRAPSPVNNKSRYYDTRPPPPPADSKYNTQRSQDSRDQRHRSEPAQPTRSRAYPRASTESKPKLSRFVEMFSPSRKSSEPLPMVIDP